MERPAAKVSLSIGDEAPYFSLRATDGKIYTISDFADKQGLVVVFTCNHCPYAQAYETRICELAALYQSRDVQFITICANDGDSFPQDGFEKMVEKSEALGFPFPYLHDEEQVVAKAYDAECTPEVFVFDAERKLFYHGRIDDNHRDPALVTQHSLHDALDALCSGETPPEPMTSVIGCSIKWKA